MGQKVAIVGAERLAAILVRRIPGGYRKVIFSPKRAEALALADEVGGLAIDQFSALQGCDLLLLTMSGLEAADLLYEAEEYLENVLVVHMATEESTERLAKIYPGLRISTAKLIGDLEEIEQGAPALVILDRLEPGDDALLFPLLEGVGPLMLAPESKVTEINGAVARVLTRAVTNLSTELTALGLGAREARAVMGALGHRVFRGT